jgi:hypothetical protein
MSEPDSDANDEPTAVELRNARIALQLALESHVNMAAIEAIESVERDLGEDVVGAVRREILTDNLDGASKARIDSILDRVDRRRLDDE